MRRRISSVWTALLALAQGCAQPTAPAQQQGATVATEKRSLAELINTQEPGIALVREWAVNAPREVVFLPVDRAAGERTLLSLQLTTRSPLGAIAYETGGILVDDGWLRILGSGSERLQRSLSDWNRIDQPQEGQRFPGALVVADDALGGFFALNGGRFPGPVGTVHYLAPDTVQWEDLEIGYSQWLQSMFSPAIDEFYKDLRWPGWRDEVRALRGDQGISVYPFLWAAQGGPIGERTRKAVPIEELWGLHAIESPRQLGGKPE